jgi:hypothetical protein
VTTLVASRRDCDNQTMRYGVASDIFPRLCWCEHCNGKYERKRKTWSAHLSSFAVSPEAPPLIVEHWQASKQAAASVAAASITALAGSSVLSGRPALATLLGKRTHTTAEEPDDRVAAALSHGDREPSSSPLSAGATCVPPSFTDSNPNAMVGLTNVASPSLPSLDWENCSGLGDDSSVEGELEYPPRSPSGSESESERDAVDAEEDVRNGSWPSTPESAAHSRFLFAVAPTLFALLIPVGILSSGEPARLGDVVRELAVTAAPQVPPVWLNVDTDSCRYAWKVVCTCVYSWSARE